MIKTWKANLPTRLFFLKTKEASFVKFLVYGVVRYKKSIDDEASLLYSGTYASLNERCKNIFRIGLYQLNSMDSIPDYAAVNSTVEIAKVESSKFSKAVNAILLRFIREKRTIDIKNVGYNYSKTIIKETFS